MRNHEHIEEYISPDITFNSVGVMYTDIFLPTLYQSIYTFLMQVYTHMLSVCSRSLAQTWPNKRISIGYMEDIKM